MLMQVRHHMHQNFKIFNLWLIFDVGDVADWYRYSCWLLPGGHWSSSPTPYLGPQSIYGRDQLFFGLIHLLAKSRVYGHKSRQPRTTACVALWALEFQTCHPILWSKPRMELDHDSSCRWWKFSSLQLESKTVHGSMQRVSGEPLYKRNPIR